MQSIADYIDVDDSPRFHAQKITFTKARRRPGIVPIRCFSDRRIASDKRHNRKHLSAVIPYVCVLPTTELSINLNMLRRTIFRSSERYSSITSRMLTSGLITKKAQGRLANHGCISYWAQQDFSGVKPLVAQVKGHSFPIAAILR